MALHTWQSAALVISPPTICVRKDHGIILLTLIAAHPELGYRDNIGN